MMDHRPMLKLATCHSYETDCHSSDTGTEHVPETIAVRFADVVPLLVHAAQSNREWLDDFSDDVVALPQDLYDVLIAYQDMVVRRVA